MNGLEDKKPVIVVPRPAPKSLQQVLIIALVAYRQLRETDGVPLAATYVEQNLRYADAAAASAACRSLCGRRNIGKWLKRTRVSKGTKPHEYVLGPEALKARQEWEELGVKVWGDGGVLQRFAGKPSMVRSGLGPLGLIGLAHLADFGPCEPVDLRNALLGLQSRTTVNRGISRLIEAEVVVSEGGKLALPPDWAERLANFEDRTGLTARTALQDHNIMVRRQVHRDGKGVFSAFPVEADRLRRMPCLYCRKAPRHGSPTVEHFPPKKFGGGNRLSLLLPACKPCNSRYGGMLKGPARLTVPPTELIVRAADIGGIEQFWLNVMLADHIEFTRLLEAGRVAEARALVAARFPVWVALHENSAVRVDLSTEEIVEPGEPLPYALPDDMITEHGVLLRMVLAADAAA